MAASRSSRRARIAHRGQSTSRLLLACPDRPGLIAAVSGFLADAGLNIVDADQHSTGRGAALHAHADGLRLGCRGSREREALQRRFSAGGRRPVRDGPPLRRVESRRKRVAIMVSREDHCLSDLLWRWRSGELGGELVASSPTTPTTPSRSTPRSASPSTTSRSTPARGRPPSGGPSSCSASSTCSSSPATCRSSSADFLRDLGAPAINIHHSFLPAFVGADPYRRAHERGVKLIGATAHYVTPSSTPDRSSTRT